MSNDILIVGGYGEVGRRLTVLLEGAHPGAVVVGGRYPKLGATPCRVIDVDDPASIEAALEGVGVVVACVRQREPHLLRAAVRRGIGYTSIAPPWMDWTAAQVLHLEARQTGARIVLATGLEPGISSVLARVAADRLPRVDRIETALLLGVGDAYGGDSLAFLFEELAQAYAIQVDGRTEPAFAFARSKRVRFPAPIGARRVYTIPFRDQLYYPHTLGAQTAIAWIAIDPPWLGGLISAATRLGARALARKGGARLRLHALTEKLRRRYADRSHFGLVVEVSGGDRLVRCSLVGRAQAQATAVGAAAVAEALWLGEVREPGVWLVEQVIEPKRFLGRLSAQGLEPVFEERGLACPPRQKVEVAHV